MSGRFVRQSSFRHVFGTAEKPENQFLSLKASFNGDGSFIAGNGKYLAYAGQGGGGPVVIQTMNDVGRAKLNVPKLAVHKAKVLDFAFNPFIDEIIATGGEDCYIKISKIPDGGLTENLTKAEVTLEGHERKITSLKFHPTANNVLTSISYDKTVKIWDIETGAEQLSFNQFDDHVF